METSQSVSYQIHPNPNSSMDIKINWTTGIPINTENLLTTFVTEETLDVE